MNFPVEKIVRDYDRLERFEDAIDVAKRTRRELEAMDFEISDVETAIPPVRGRDGAVLLTGIIDFVIRFDGERYPVEVKSPHPLMFEKLHSLEDFDRRGWTRKWVDQLVAYLYAHGRTEGFILLVALGAKKWFHLDLRDDRVRDRAASALKLAEIAGAAHRDGWLPEFASDPDVCRSCWAFGTVCQPPVDEKAAERIDDEEFYSLALRAEELKPSHAEYEAIWNRLRKTVQTTGAARVVCRDVAFTVSERAVKEFTVAARVDRIVKMFRLGQKAKVGA